MDFTREMTMHFLGPGIRKVMKQIIQRDISDSELFIFVDDKIVSAFQNDEYAQIVQAAKEHSQHLKKEDDMQLDHR